MANLALLRDAGRSVIRIGGALVILQMAGHTRVSGQVEISAAVALVTL